MAKKLSPDISFLSVVCLLLGFGLVMVWSASSPLAQGAGTTHFFLLKQLLWAAVGVGVMVAALRLPYHVLRRPQLVYALLGTATLLLIVVLFMPELNNSHRWIRVGPLSFQPAELAKLSVVVFLAYYIEKRGERIRQLSTLAPALLLLFWFSFLVLVERDLGSAFCIGLTGGVMLFVAGVPLRYFAPVGVLAAGGLAVAILAVPWRFRRVLIYLDPWTDPLGAGYQIIQSLIAVGTGGLTGVGLGEGRQKLYYLPYAYSDFIFSVIGEELGLLGALGVVAAFMVLLWRGLRAFWRAPDDFGRFLALGFTVAIVLQALINVSVAIGLLPTKGIPLPFLSAGGSSLVFALAAAGLVANVSQYTD